MHEAFTDIIESVSAVDVYVKSDDFNDALQVQTSPQDKGGSVV